MNYEFLVKLAGLLLSSIATIRLASEWLHGRQSRLRQEYKFAREFFQDLETKNTMHPFLKQKGYQAIAANGTLSAKEIAYLLTLHDPARALRDYSIGRKYLLHVATNHSTEITFSPRYRSKWARLWRKSLYFLLYLVAFLAAFSPVLLPMQSAIPSDKLWYLLCSSMLLFAPPGILSLRAGARIARAEALVKKQAANS
jgi:hypothetical protein